MDCYKDRWYCEKYRTCKLGKYCTRALTPEVQKDASIAGLLVDVRDNPNCYEEVKG
jgi:hypothetical protein